MHIHMRRSRTHAAPTPHSRALHISRTHRTISQAELAVVVEKFGLKLTNEQLADYISEFDTDGDGGRRPR